MQNTLAFIALAAALVLAGCTNMSSPADVERSQLTFPVVSELGGVIANESGAIALVAADGLRVDADAPNATLTIGLGPKLLEQGVIQACRAACMDIPAPNGTIIAERTLVSLRNLSLNALGPEGDSTLFAYEGGQQTGAFLRWWHDGRTWQTSGALDVQGRITAAGPLSTLTPVSTGPNSAPLIVGTAAAQGIEDLLLLRGSAQLLNGTATVAFPAAFRALIDPSAITAQVTPTSRGEPLFVSERAADHITVQTMSGAQTAQTFDYFVQAVRASETPFVSIRTA